MTREQQEFIGHAPATFLQACPGAGKTRAIVGRLLRVAKGLPERQGVALLSFTNKSVDELERKAAEQDATRYLRYPGYHGTLDSFVRAFIFAPFPPEGTTGKVHVVESWTQLNAVVRLRGAGGAGISLDAFDPSTNEINFSRVEPQAARSAAAQREEYQRAARGLRARYRARGYFSAADARHIALGRIREHDFGRALGRAVAARFQEVIVDEAQDCNPEDLEILSWMQDHGVRVTMVCDLDQSIFEFRESARVNVERFVARYPENDQLRLTGNFRSAPSVCRLAASLRSNCVPDNPLGEFRELDWPVLVKPYGGRTPDRTLGAWFVEEATAAGLDSASLIVLAHVGNNARLAAGGKSLGNGQSKIERLARAVGEMRTGITGHARVLAIKSVEKLLLEISGRLESGESVRAAIERLGVNARELKRQALECITRLSPTCGEDELARAAWIRNARQLISSLVSLPPGTTIGQALATPAGSDWCRHLRPQGEMAAELSFSTIHNAKGGQYDGVMVVIPPDGRDRRSSDFVDAWAGRIDHEPKRVIYVGVTRAKRLLALALPEALVTRCVAVLDGNDVPYRMIR